MPATTQPVEPSWPLRGSTGGWAQLHLRWMPHSALLREGLPARGMAPAQAGVQGTGGSRSKCSCYTVDWSSYNACHGDRVPPWQGLLLAAAVMNGRQCKRVSMH
jgi:hypothetical protein